MAAVSHGGPWRPSPGLGRESKLALDCVAFANAQGGELLLGVEDGQAEPPPEQAIPSGLAETVAQRMRDLTVNVDLAATVTTAPNGGQLILLRVGDTCQPVVGDDVARLLADRPSRPWELLPVADLHRADLDAGKCATFVAAVRASMRVKDSVKDKSAEELLDHYDLTAGDAVTHLGALLLGRRHHRARLGTAPVVQCLKFDEQGQKVNEWVWDDHALSPVELVDAVWQGVPDFRETYELPEGLYRRSSPAFDEKVLRELLVNALVHCPYTQPAPQRRPGPGVPRPGADGA